ncbi:MAG: hypothetical protein IPG89_17740 [Bacteroidetes bacterium]|nr:hypothetical protein [Bacteroidota bacterium]
MNRSKYILVFILSLLVFSSSLVAQPASTNDQLALQYYNNKEYDKAIVYYEKLYDKNPYSYYEYYLTCLLKTDDKKKAEKIIKKQIKLLPESVSLYVDLGELYKLDNDLKNVKSNIRKQ